MNQSIDTKSYWESRLAENFNDRGVGDIGLPESYNRFLYRVRRQVFKRALKLARLDVANAKVIDFGSGTGFYIRNWMETGCKDLCGSDLTEVAVKNLSSEFPTVSFQQIDIGAERIPVAPSSYDAASCFDVLFHVVDDVCYDRAILNIATSLKKDGVFLYSDNLLLRAFDVTHQVGRTEATIVEKLKEHGFEIEARIPMFVLMNDPVRTKSRLLRKLFSLAYRFACISPLTGTLVGGAIYLPELFLTKALSNGPSTEVLVCRRK